MSQRSRSRPNQIDLMVKMNPGHNPPEHNAPSQNQSDRPTQFSTRENAVFEEPVKVTRKSRQRAVSSLDLRDIKETLG